MLPSDPTALDATAAGPGPDEAPAARPAPRQLGPYHVVREVGRGGMGAVYEVRHPDHPDRALALKVMLGQPDGVALQRFAREAELLARVRHRGVLSVHHAGRLPEGPYLVTDLVVGSSLAGLPRAGAVPPRRAAELVRDLADAVAALHAAGVLHRDLKPDNVLLREEDGSPVLLDFGIARDLAAERLTATGTVVGTPAYLAPEQAEGASPSALDARVDVYGLGGLLFFLLADRAPHAAATPLMSIKRALVDEPAWPSRDRADVPPELEGILRRAMARQRDDRYPTAAALRDDLARWLAGQRPAAPAPPRRRGALVAGLAGLAVVAALAAALARGHDAPPAPPSPTTEPTIGRPATEPTTEPTTEPPATEPATEPPARGSWQARLHAASPPPWSQGPHLVLQAAPDGPVKAAFLDDDRVVTVTGSTLAVWTLEGQRDLQTEPASSVDLPLGDEPLPHGFHEDRRHLARRPGGLLVAAALTRGLCEVTLDGARASVTRRPLLLSGAGVLSGALAALGEDALVARLTNRRVGRLTSQVLRVDPAGRARPLFDVPGSVQALAARGDLVAAASRLSGQTSGGVVVWNVAEGRQVLRLDQAASACLAVAFDPSGAWLAVGQAEGLLERVDLATSARRDLVTSSEVARLSPVAALTFDPAGRLWSAGGERKRGELVGWAHDRPIDGLVRAELPFLVSVDAAPSGRAIVAGTAKGEAHVWLVPPP